MSTSSPKGAETEMTSQASNTTTGSIPPAQNRLANTANLLPAPCELYREDGHGGRKGACRG